MLELELSIEWSFGSAAGDKVLPGGMMMNLPNVSLPLLSSLSLARSTVLFM